MELLDKLVSIMDATNTSKAKLIKDLGIPQDRVYKWFQQKTKPKHDDAKKIEDWIKIQESGKIKVSNEEAIAYESANNKDLSLQAIVNLTTTNQTLANNSSRLITLLEEKERKTTVGDHQEKFSIAPETVQALLQVFGEVATGKRWKSKVEFEAYVNTLSFDKIMKKQAVGK
jgi:hypothetical protein